MFAAADCAGLRESIALQHNQALIPMHVPVFRTMLQTQIRCHRQLENAAVSMVDPPTLVRGVFVLAMVLRMMVRRMIDGPVAGMSHLFRAGLFR